MSGAKLLRQQHTGNRLADDTNRNVELFARAARKSPFWDGNLVTQTFVANTLTNVNHGLSRAYRGWIVVRMIAASAPVIIEPPYSSALTVNPTVYVPLESNQGCIATIWFF